MINFLLVHEGAFFRKIRPIPRAITALIIPSKRLGTISAMAAFGEVQRFRVENISTLTAGILRLG